MPLFVQDFTGDERLTGCSPSSVGIYIFLLCFLHKSDTYGKLVLRPKDRLTEDEISELKKLIESKTQSKSISKSESKIQSKIQSNVILFAKRLQRNMPFELHEIAEGLNELIEENVITVEGETLYQRRMVRDGEISEKRSNIGALGGRPTAEKDEEKSKTKSKSESKNESKSESKNKANSEYEYEYENNNINIEEKEVKEKRKERGFTPPTLEEVMQYCEERKNGIDAFAFFDFYEANGWVQGKQGKPLKDWKAAVRYWERNGVNITNGNNGNRTGTAEGAAKGGFGEVYTDTPAKKTRHTTL